MASDVSENGAGVHLSISALAQEFEVSRETLRRRLAAAGVQPSGEHRGNPLWRVRDAYQAIITGSDSPISPAALPPFQRKAYFQAQREEIQYLQECGQLVAVDAVREESARIFKLLKQFLDTLGDILERDCGLSGPQVQKVDQRIDELREALYLKICENPDEPTAQRPQPE